MHVSIDGDDLRTGLVSLVVALAEIVKETLKLQALRRLEAGRLTEEELERLGMALNDLDEAFERMKMDLGSMRLSRRCATASIGRSTTLSAAL